MIEDFMLAANEAVAHFFTTRGLDTLWRVHAPPSAARLEEFAVLAQSFGIPFNAEDLRTPAKLRDFLAGIAGSSVDRVLSYLLLRSLKQAVYDVHNIGHFGLAAPEYLHFTSPIRRYPDLVVHRLLKRQLRLEGLPAGGDAPAPHESQKEELVRTATACSGYERRAMEAEREVVDMYRAFLMRDQIGEEFTGTIVGVTSFGLFIEIPEPFVEGLIKSEKLGMEPFDFDERTIRLVGERSGRAFSLGDTVRVRVENVSVQRRQIDLGLLSSTATAAPPPTPRTKKKSNRRVTSA
jgi:ribonuclease R